jgi:hypothetical protein
MSLMFGKSKEEDRITEVDIRPATVFCMTINTEQGGRAVLPITTNLSESEIRTLIEGYIDQNGKLDFLFENYLRDNGYQFIDLAKGREFGGSLVTTAIYFIYK